MFAVGVGNAVEDELREIASEPVAEHYFYTADFKTINQIGMKLQKKICVGEQGQGWPGWAGLVGREHKWSHRRTGTLCRSALWPQSQVSENRRNPNDNKR